MDIRFLLLLVCFFVSGFAALLYQTAWTREFAFLFGTSELAVVAVLAAYMAGLALGAAIAARFVDRLVRPVLAYGLLELGIAIGALLVPFLIRAVQAAYLGVAGGLDAPPETMSLGTAIFHLFGSFVVLVPCTALMGATLPLLARHAVDDDTQVGPRIGLLYATNTFGAIAGTLIAAFYLLPAFGLRQTVYLGIAGNAIVFLAAWALARGVADRAPETNAAAATSRPFHWILPAMTLSGVVSFVYEVLWTRLLGQVLGGSTAAFASMLSSFLLGIALGSAVASRFATSREAAARGFVLVQIGAGLLGYAAFRAADRLPELAHAVGAHPAAPAAGAAAAGVMLLPVTLCIGATFPFGVRLLARDADEAASVSGRVYAWNTVGSILGAILAGFFLLPMLGLERTALVGVTTSLGLGLAAALLSTPRRTALAGVAAAAMLLCGLVGLPQPKDLLLHSAMTGTRMEGDLYYLGVGRSATVSVVEHSRGWRLFTNGLPESGVNRAALPDLRFNETAWLSLLPTAARPETEDMLIIGLGGAKTLAATASTVRSIDVIELEEEVVVANRLMPRPVDPFADERVSLRLGDARGAMQLSEKTYDAIVSQPSHPWTSGASHLYTREFFELVDEKLEPGGTFVQWIGQGFVDVPLFGSLAAAMTDVFAHVHVYRPVPAALVFIASQEPIDLAESGPLALAAAPDSFSAAGIHRVEDLLASLSLDDAGVRAIGEGQPLNTDDHNRLATTRLPPARHDSTRKAVDARFDELDPWTQERLAGVDAVRLLRRMAWTGEINRAIRLSERLSEVDQWTLRAWIGADNGRLGSARPLLLQAVAAAPDAPAVRAGLIRVHTPSFFEQLPEGFAWTPREQVVLDASERRAAQDWSGLAALDGALTEFDRDDWLYDQAIRLRSLWRIESGDPARAAEAIPLLDGLLTRHRTRENYFLRLRAAVEGGETEIAWAALEHFASPQALRKQNVARRLLGLAAQLGTPPDFAAPVAERIARAAGAAGTRPRR